LYPWKLCSIHFLIHGQGSITIDRQFISAEALPVGYGIQFACSILVDLCCYRTLSWDVIAIFLWCRIQYWNFAARVFQHTRQCHLQDFRYPTTDKSCKYGIITLMTSDFRALMISKWKMTKKILSTEKSNSSGIHTR
jgi:hypothetical protein